MLSCMRPILPGYIKSVILRMPSLFLDSVSFSNSLSTSCQAVLGFRCRHSSQHFRKYHLLNKISTNTGLKLFTTNGKLCTGTSNRYSEQQDERNFKKGPLSEISIRQDRQLSFKLFQEILREKGDDPWISEDWIRVGEQLAVTLRSSWEVMCMHILMNECNLDAGRSLMNFLEGRPKPPGPVVTTFYIGLLGKTCQGNQEQESELKKYYDGLVAVMEVFDAASIEVLAEGLSYTKYYKECITLLDMYKFTCPPGPALLKSMLMGALRNRDLELCTDALRHIEECTEPSNFTIFAASMIDVAIASKNRECMVKLFDFMQKHWLILPKNQLETVIESFQRSDPGQWKGTFGFAHGKAGNCTVCGHQFQKIRLEKKEFKAIQSAFADQVIVSENIFFKSSPREVENFKKFVDKVGPFDVVIDGLNVLFAMKYPPSRPSTETLERVVYHYCKLNKRVLVLGSMSLKSHLGNIVNFKKRPAIYMTSTTRADDAFFLYAALQSGMNTVIVSRDKLRDHRSKLDRNLKPIFDRWLRSNQVHSCINHYTGEIDLKQHKFDLGPTEDDKGWHIPMNDTDSRYPFGRQGILCLRHGPQNFEDDKDNRSFFTDNVKPNTNRWTPPNKEWFD